MSDEIIRAAAERAHVDSIDDLLKQVVGKDLRRGIGGTSRAAIAWNEANGDRERAHTRGVTLVTARKPGADPRMIVYVDSNVLLSDFRANTELYLGRLSMWGLQVSSLEFRLSRTAGQPAPQGARGGGVPSAGDAAGSAHVAGHAAGTGLVAGGVPGEPDLPPLTPAQEREIGELTADLPDGVRDKAASAMSVFYRRENLEGR